MRKGAMLLGAGAAMAVATGAGALFFGSGSVDRHTLLLGDDYVQLRHDALDLFPRGKPVTEVRDELKALGFDCAPTHRGIPNVNAPTLECDSAGRGYPKSGRVQVTIMARNGHLADLAVGSGLEDDVADVRSALRTASVAIHAEALQPSSSRAGSPPIGDGDKGDAAHGGADHRME